MPFADCVAGRAVIAGFDLVASRVNASRAGRFAQAVNLSGCWNHWSQIARAKSQTAL